MSHRERTVRASVAAVAGSLLGLFASGFTWASPTLAALVGLLFGLVMWAILLDSHDKYVTVKMPTEVEPLARVRAGTEEESG